MTIAWVAVFFLIEAFTIKIEDTKTAQQRKERDKQAWRPLLLSAVCIAFGYLFQYL